MIISKHTFTISFTSPSKKIIINFFTFSYKAFVRVVIRKPTNVDKYPSTTLIGGQFYNKKFLLSISFVQEKNKK